MRQIRSVILASLFAALVSTPAIATSGSEYRQLGLSYRQQGRFDDAIAAMRKSVELEPQNTPGRVNLGWTLHLAGQEREAAVSLWQAIYQKPFHDAAYNALGIVYLVEGNLTAAVLIHTWATVLKPENEVAYYNLSLALNRLKVNEIAIATAKYAAKLEPNNPHPLVSGAVAYWDSGNLNVAQSFYRRAINLDNRYKDTSFLSHLQQAAFNGEQIDSAKQILASLK
jgi:Flp pilus assembly protein TadD